MTSNKLSSFHGTLAKWLSFPSASLGNSQSGTRQSNPPTGGTKNDSSGAGRSQWRRKIRCSWIGSDCARYSKNRKVRSRSTYRCRKGCQLRHLSTRYRRCSQLSGVRVGLICRCQSMYEASQSGIFFLSLARAPSSSSSSRSVEVATSLVTSDWIVLVDVLEFFASLRR